MLYNRIIGWNALYSLLPVILLTERPVGKAAIPQDARDERAYALVAQLEECPMCRKAAGSSPVKGLMADVFHHQIRHAAPKATELTVERHYTGDPTASDGPREGT